MIRQLFVSYVAAVLCIRNRFEGFDSNRPVFESYVPSCTKRSLFKAQPEIQYLVRSISTTQY